MTLAGLASGVGGNWAASLVERGYRQWSATWGSNLGVGSDEIARGLSVALERAVARVEPELDAENAYRLLLHRDREAAHQLREGVRAMGENAAQVVARVAAQPTRADWSGQVAAVREEDALWPLLAARVDDALFGHDPALVRWLQGRLATAWQEEWQCVLRGPDQVGRDARQALQQQLWQHALSGTLATIQEDTRATRETVERLLSAVEETRARTEETETAGAVETNPMTEAFYSALETTLTERLVRIERKADQLLSGQEKIQATSATTACPTTPRAAPTAGSAFWPRRHCSTHKMRRLCGDSQMITLCSCVPC